MNRDQVYSSVGLQGCFGMYGWTLTAKDAFSKKYEFQGLLLSSSSNARFVVALDMVSMEPVNRYPAAACH
jgi:hypothetical protein